MNAVTMKRAAVKLKTMSNVTFKNCLISTGIVKADGKLTAKYQQPKKAKANVRRAAKKK